MKIVVDAMGGEKALVITFLVIAPLHHCDKDIYENCH